MSDDATRTRERDAALDALIASHAAPASHEVLDALRALVLALDTTRIPSAEMKRAREVLARHEGGKR